jgi:hypothetical protein
LKRVLPYFSENQMFQHLYFAWHNDVTPKMLNGVIVYVRGVVMERKAMNTIHGTTRSRVFPLAL